MGAHGDEFRKHALCVGTVLVNPGREVVAAERCKRSRMHTTLNGANAIQDCILIGHYEDYCDRTCRRTKRIRNKLDIQARAQSCR